MSKTELERLQAELEDKNTYIRLLFEQMHEAYALHEMLFDEQGNPSDYIFLEGNRRFKELMGLAPEEIKGKRVWELFPETAPELIARYGPVVAKNEPLKTIVYATYNGNYYLVSAFKVGDSRFATLFYDITEQELNKQELEKRSKERERLLKEYQTLFDATNDAIFLVRAEVKGDLQTFYYIRNNRFHQEQTGLSPEMLAGKTPEELFGANAGAKVSKNFKDCIDQKKTIRYEEEVHLPGGTKTWMTELTPVFEGRDVYYIVGASADITENRKREEAIKEALDQAESASRAKGVFLSTMSHEIRTPMNAIVGLTHLIKNTVDETKTPELSLYLDDIQSSAKELMEVISDILDFADITMNQVTYSEEPIHLRRIINDAQRFFANELDQKNIEFQTVFSDEYREIYVADEAKLRKIFNHLISNAVKYTPEGKIEISVAAENDREEASEIVVTVTDTGIGISREKVGNVFVPFFQEDGSVARKYRGVGLGLPVVKGLLEHMGGSISITDTFQDKGTTFTMRIPLKKQKNHHGNYGNNPNVQRIYYDEALKKLGGDEKIYLDILKSYQEYAGDLIQKIKESSEKKDSKELQFHLHTLKGMSLNIGALTIADLAADAEKETKDNLIPEASIAWLGSEHHKVTEEIGLLLRREKSLEPQEHFHEIIEKSSDAAHQSLKKIHQLVCESSFVDDALVMQAKYFLRTNPRLYSIFMRVVGELENYQYVKAKKSLEELIQKMEKNRDG